MSSLPLPASHGLRLMYASSIVIAIVAAIVSFAGILYRGALYPASQTLSSTGNDAFNLAVVLPALLLSMLLARRGSLIGLLAWPGMLFYVLYIYVFYVIGLPVNALFLAYVLLVVLSTYTIIGLIASVDGDAVRQRLAGAVPDRAAGVVLVGLAALFIGIDAYAAIADPASPGSADLLARGTWVADLVVECPALFLGGVLLWRRAWPGYVAGAGLLLQIALLLIGVPVSFLLGSFLTGQPADMSPAMLIIIGVIPLALFMFFARGIRSFTDREVSIK